MEASAIIAIFRHEPGWERSIFVNGQDVMAGVNEVLEHRRKFSEQILTKCMATLRPAAGYA